ncbi:MAG: ABC transporter permease [Myxococcota bacterium]|nr:ABC transporter permease [Myxococcota bacterium]
MRQYSDTRSPSALRITRICPGGDSLAFHLRELARSFGLVALLMRKDLLLRYRDTYLGLAWAIVQPLVTVLVFWFAFGVMGKIRTSEAYPLFSMAGLVPFGLLSAVATRTASSLSSNAYLVSRVYFPRFVLPLSSTAAPLLDAAIGCALLLAMALVSRNSLPWSLCLAPLALVLPLALGLGLGLVAAALSVTVRDVRAALPVALQLLLLGTPVAYPSDAVPEQFAFIVTLNPASCAVDLFRASVLGHSPDPSLIAPALTATILLWAVGLPFFHRAARSCADTL